VVVRGVGVAALLAGVLSVPGSAFAASADLQLTGTATVAQVGEEGSPFSHTITLTNAGPDTAATVTVHLDAEPLTWTFASIAVSGIGATLGPFNFDAARHTIDATATNLPSGGTLTLQAQQIAPGHPGVETTTGTLTSSSPVDANASNNRASVATTVTGLVVSPAAFGDQLLGVLGAAKTITVTNDSAQAVTLGNPANGGAGASDFVFSDLGTCPGATLPVGASCTFAERFAPGAVGDRAATVTAAPSSGAVDAASGTLSGRGISPPSPTPPDTTRPAVAISGLPSSITLKKLLKNGVRFKESANEPTAFTNELYGSVGSASLARLAKAFNLRLAQATFPLSTSTRTVAIKPNRRLIGKRKKFSLQVVVTGTDAAGNRTTTSRTIKVH
jgi:Domain of unknown function DUF11